MSGCDLISGVQAEGLTLTKIQPSSGKEQIFQCDSIEAAIDEIWQKYFDAIEEMANSRLFDIVAHIDLIKIFKFMPKRDIADIAKNALLAIKEANMSIEINVAGFRKPIGEAYPSLSLLLEAKKLDIPITFASDAHKPEQVGLYSNEALNMAKFAGYEECVFYRKREIEFVKF